MKYDKSTGQFIKYWEELGHLIDAGEPLLHALEIMEKETEGTELHDVTIALRRDVEAGKSLSESMKNYDIFLPFEVDLIKIGQSVGCLDKVLLKISDMLKKGVGYSKRPKGKVPSIEQINTSESEKVMKKVYSLIFDAVDKGASSIHIEPCPKETKVRCRIDGVLQEAESMSKEDGLIITSKIKRMAGLDVAEKRLPQDGRIILRYKNKQMDLMVATMPALYGENIVLRISVISGNIPKLEELTPSKQEIRTLRELVKKPTGVIFVCGPTGSGTRTTVYSILNHINSPRIKIATVEDPVLHSLEGTIQIQIKPQIGLTYAKSMRHILRTDPDIIYVSEVKDLESAQMVVQAGMTGHLVLSRLHTNDSTEAIRVLKDIGLTQYFFSRTLIAVTAQRLVRLLCPACKEKYSPAQSELGILGLKKTRKIYKEKGCNKCNGTGYKGRTALFEFFIPNDEIRSMICEGREVKEIREAAIKAGMKTMREGGKEKILKGICSINEIARVTGGFAADG